MLGVNEKRELITGQYAQEIRERMRRILSGELNDSDRQEINRHKEILKDINVVWK